MRHFAKGTTRASRVLFGGSVKAIRSPKETDITVKSIQEYHA